MNREVLTWPEFQIGQDGAPRMVVRVDPPEGTPVIGVILGIQAFGDEATLSRRVMLAQARQWAELGWLTLIPDLYGTGDSAGATQDASLAIWMAELEGWVEQARRECALGPFVLWGVRMGALLAMRLAGCIKVPCHQLYWQAPESGRSLIEPLRKLGRVRAGADAAMPDPMVREANLHPADDAPFDVERLAGYRLRAELIDQLAQLEAVPPLSAGFSPARALFLNTQRVLRPEQPLPASLAAMGERWREAGFDTRCERVAGEPFWSSMEPSSPQDTFAASQAWLAEFELPAAVDRGLARAQPRAAAADARVAEGVVERVVVCQGEQGPVFGVLSLPARQALLPPERTTPAQSGSIGAVLIVPGQPQTRVGSHRMFVDLARGLAGSGIASLRVDVGGWGDSPGEARAFEHSALDIAAAAECLSAELHRLGYSRVGLWVGGLCDGGSAAVLATPELNRRRIAPAGWFLLNPWVRSEASLGDAMIRNYYAKRILDPELWKRIVTGKVSFANLVGEPIRFLRAKLSPKPLASGGGVDDLPASGDLPGQLLHQLNRSPGQLALVLSGSDLTAAESEALMAKDPRWRQLFERPGSALCRLAGADHTFSQEDHWRAAIEWLAGEVRRDFFAAK